MNDRRTRLFKGFAAFCDQAWLSVINFAVAIAFIRGASKEEYALFVLLQAPLFLFLGLQNALFLSPQATVLPVRQGSSRDAAKATSILGQCGFALSIAIVGAIGLFAFISITGRALDPLVVIGFSLAIVGTLAREGARANQYLEGRPVAALGGDLVYGVLMLLGVLGLAISGLLTAGAALLALGAAGLVPLSRHAFSFSSLKWDRDAWHDFWQCGRWALPSVLVSWLNLNSYPYICAVALGAAAVAEINAARLIFMPAVLGITAWSNLYRPRFSLLLARSQGQDARRLSVRSTAVAEIGLLAYIGTVYMLYPLIEAAAGPAYAGLQHLALAWGGFFALTFLRSVWMASVMADSSGYRQLHHLSWFSLLIVLPALFFLAANGPVWVVGILCAVEMVQAMVVLRWARNRWSASG